VVRGPAEGYPEEEIPDVPGDMRVWSVLAVDVVDGRIQAVRIVRNPDKLGHL
jgi:RNA polymerase sigma-70 factor (ECF subfamily)